MATISIQNYVDGVLTNATTVKLRDIGGTFGIRRTSDLSIVVTPTAAITPTSTGTYSYDTTSLANGEYEAQWEVVNGLFTDYTQQIFDVDAAEVVLPGPTLKEIEQNVARRIGPWDEHVVASGTTAAFIVNKLKRSVDLGGVEDMYILRRGFTTAGIRITGYNADDRVRSVAEYNYATGELQPDRTYNTAPAVNEKIELMSMDPEHVAYAVQRGLERAMFFDTLNLTLSGMASERDISSLASWITLPAQIHMIEAGFSSALLYPGKTGWLRLLARQGKVRARMALDPYPNQAVVHAWRPSNSLVNGSTSLIGPQDDTDYIHIPLALAAAAGHIEAWRYFPEEMANRAATGLRPSQEQAASVFTLEQRKMRKNIPAVIDTVHLEWSAQGSSLGLIP